MRIPDLLRTRLHRPFPVVHGALLAVLALAWGLALALRGCEDAPAGALPMLALFTLMLSAWTRHLRLAPLRRAADLARLLGGVAWDLVGLAVFAVLAALPFVGYGCYTQKARASELVLATSEVRAEIAQRLASGTPPELVGRGLAVPPTKRTVASLVGDDGRILVVGRDPAAVVVMTPRVSGMTVEWTCRMLPAELALSSCR